MEAAFWTIVLVVVVKALIQEGFERFTGRPLIESPKERRTRLLRLQAERDA
jgi:hypothetical protein